MSGRCAMDECGYCAAERLYDTEFLDEQAEQERHGKVRMYLVHGCECDDCKAAVSAYWARRYQRRKLEAAESGLDHDMLDLAASQMFALLTTQTQLK